MTNLSTSSRLTVMLFASLNAYTMANGGLYTELQSRSPKEVAFLTRDYHNQCYITTTVNNLMTVLISGVRGQKSSQSLTALSHTITKLKFNLLLKY